MSQLVLYGIDISPPVRACLMLLKALDVPYEFKVVNIMTQEHLSEEFLRHNPQHTVPVLDDNGTWIWDSHVICAYLVDKYGKDDSLYPKDLAQRAQVTQRLYFDASILFMALRNITKPLIQDNVTIVLKEKTRNLLEGYQLVETFLADNEYIAGNTLTIADFCCVATVSSLRGIVDVNMAKFPRTYAWLERMSKLPYYNETNGQGVQKFIGFVQPKLKTIIM